MRIICRGVLLSLFVSAIIEGCFNNSQPSTYAKGEKTARKYCSSCHLFVPPKMLDSITWSGHILPEMASKLGIRVRKGKPHYRRNSNDSSPPKISYREWRELVQYYTQLAPDKLKPAKMPVPFRNDWSIFRLRIPTCRDTVQKPTTTLVKIDPSHHIIYSGNAGTNGLFKWNKQLKIIGEYKFPSPPVNISLIEDETNIVTCIGVLKAAQLTEGTIVYKMKNGVPMPYRTLNLDNGQIIAVSAKNKKDTKTMANKLRRPVETVSGDFNKDGLLDWVVCAFGHDQGGLFLYQQGSKKEYNRKTISSMPGAEEAIVQDFNHDGWPDIMALFAQAREGIWLFLNDKKGGFTSRNILKFQPEYGSTSFQLVDFNKDGKQDILYTCGDNGDYSQILKPYHGIYIFLNYGNFKYKKTYFYPINGCTKAMAADFDMDGDMDIAAIAFFADFKNKPSESFVYYEQDGPLHFIPHAIPVHNYGRWLCMDVGDYDGDKDLDIVLGSYTEPLLKRRKIKSKWNNSLPLIVLANNSVK